MSEPESFIARWARRKRQADEAERQPADHDTPVVSDSGEPRQSESAATAADPSPPAFDPASLPPLESITAATDIRAFLQTGVPAALSRAALRRAWATDPTISGFVGLSENSWDFTAPNTIPGFGAIDPADIPRLMANAGHMFSGEQPLSAIGEAAPLSPPEIVEFAKACDTPPTASGQAASTSGQEQSEHQSPEAPAIERKPAVDAAMQNQTQPEKTSLRRPHGRALPT